ncbi:ABC transporter ATP-binding protein [Kribbella sandramycini]|uniref:ABC transporter ATP-binding protein n=1 Tax=Kribbella sandramycini TaxID=60450 RepID=A0A7Y4KUH4_9ACTN|nr:ABC transporter ATP-binding protein [Kribbella sandramycini]MBB6568644.1 ATP-binding cassette subfamily B protein [Kribbella sandramycini]NOL38770.1 ABC transporter ATP-binding protein [Kribbella sandramycini]
MVLRDAMRTASNALTDAVRVSPGWLVLCCLLVLVQSVLPGAQVLLISQLVDGLAGGGRPWGALVVLTVVVGLMYPLGQVALAAGQRLTLWLKLHYRVELADAAARLSPSRLADPAVVTDLEASQAATEPLGQLASRPVQVLGAAVTSAGLCTAIWSINPLSGALVLAALVPTVFAFSLISRMESAGWPKVAEQDRRAAYATEQLIRQRSGTELAVLGSGAKVAALAARHRTAATVVLDGMIAVAMWWELAAAVATALLFGGALAALVLGGASGGAAAAAVAGTISGLNAIRLCGYAFGSIVTATPQARIYRRFVASVPPAAPQTVVPVVESVALDNVTYRYPGADRPAFSNVSLSARRGELVALVGVNGAGKTTAVNLLVGGLTPCAGRILIDGRDAADLTEPERLGHFGLLVQEFGRFEFTLRDAVALGMPGDVPDDVIRTALAAAHYDRLSPDTQLGQQWGGIGISGGQWQRVALARIHLRNAGIWILDEPTSAIDAEAERDIFAGLQRTKQHRITLVVSHRASTLVEMDRIYVLDEGRVVQHGTYQQLIADPAGRFARLCAAQEG